MAHRSTTSMSSSATQQDAQSPPQLTSFGFLDEDGDPQESLFDLGSIFSRVRSAFATQEPAADEATPSVEHAVATPSTTSGWDVAASPGLPKQAVSMAEASRKASADHQRKSSKTFALGPAGTTTGPESSNTNRDSTPYPLSRTATNTTQSTSKDPQPSERFAKKSKLPFSLSSSRQAAPAIMSTTAAHAVSRNRLQSLTTSDDRSVAADDGEAEDGEDVLTALMRRSGVDPTRASAGAYSSIPGFPLHKETLADDTRSIHSTSSRMPRSEVNSTSEAQYVVAHSHSHVHQRHHSRAGLETSAEAFRRMRGEGAVLSKAFWMPDENVKECRECQSYFTPFRRKHRE